MNKDLPAAVSWLHDRSAELVAEARYSSDAGLIFYYPVADGHYPWFYLRDFAYMYESAPDLFPAHEVRPVLEMIVAKTRVDGWVPERITHDGTPIYRCHGESDVIDSGPFFIKLVGAYVEATGDLDFARDRMEVFVRALTALPTDRESSLIWIDPAHPGTGYGFTDQIAKTGREFYCSLLVFEALQIIHGWAVRLGDSARTAWCEEKMAALRQDLLLLWAEEAGMFLAASIDGRQIDVWGSIYACQIGAVSDEHRQRIVAWLEGNREKYEYLGHLRHIPEPEFWSRIIPLQKVGPGEFQNGAYWTTPTGWYAELLESVTPGAGARILCEMVSGMEKVGIWECIGRDGTRRNERNLSSILLPYASAKRIAARS